MSKSQRTPKKRIFIEDDFDGLPSKETFMDTKKIYTHKYLSKKTQMDKYPSKKIYTDKDNKLDNFFEEISKYKRNNNF